MSSVKIQDIYYDGAVDYSEKVKNIEVVPRKIVEMIIERCTEDVNDSDWRYSVDKGKICEASDIREYAELLLKQFEEGGE